MICGLSIPLTSLVDSNCDEGEVASLSLVYNIIVTGTREGAGGGAGGAIAPPAFTNLI